MAEEQQYSQVLMVTPGDRGTFTTNSTKGVNGMKKYRLVTAALVALVALAFSNTAFAHTDRALYGQCGGSVFTGAQLYNAWSAMGVIGAAAQVSASAGFHSMDNSLSVWMNQRVVRATLAQSASPEDFGCHPGQLFSVGPRMIPKGTPVMVALPSQFAKGDVSTSPRRGFVARVFTVRAVGKSNCSNPLRGTVTVILYVPVKQAPAPKPKPKPKPKPPTVNVNCPAGTVKNSAGNCVVVVVSCPAGTVTDSNGNCVTQTNTAAQACSAKGGSWDNNNQLCTIVQVNGNCSNIVVVNGSGNTVSVTQQGNCNSAPSPAPQFSCTGLSLSNSGNTVSASVSYTASGATFQSATFNWNDSTANTTVNGTSATHTYASAGSHTVNATLSFSAGGTTQTANCQASITIASPAVTVTLSNLTFPQNGPGGIYADGGSYSGWCVTVQGKAGDTIKLMSGAVLGHISQDFGTFTLSTGLDKAPCSLIYVSPNDAADVGKTETITVSATDVTAGVNATPISVSFVLQQPTTRP